MPITITCLVGQIISGRDCPGCRTGERLAFSGLKLTYPTGRGLYVTRPYEVRQIGTTDEAIISWGSQIVKIDLSDTSYALIADLLEALNGCNSATSSGSQPAPVGIFDSDTAAAAGGASVGDLYELSAANIYGLPEGALKIRRE